MGCSLCNPPRPVAPVDPPAQRATSGHSDAVARTLAEPPAQRAKRILESGSLKLLDARWLLEQPAGYVLQRCQDLAKEAFLDGTLAAKFYQLDGGRIVVLSYPWLTKQHPDPNGHHMVRVIAFLQKFVADMGVRGVGLFWDFAGLPQKGLDGSEKTEQEQEVLAEGLGAINLLYGSETTLVTQLTAMPAKKPTQCHCLNISAPTVNNTPYKDRGWCHFEETVAGILKNSYYFLDLGVAEQQLLDPHADFPALRKAAMSGRRPPLTPTDMERSLEKLRFTSGADRGKVAKIYEKFFLESTPIVSELGFGNPSEGPGWGDDELEQLSRALPAFTACKLLYLWGHSISTHGLEILAGVLPHMDRLERLHLADSKQSTDRSTYGESDLQLLHRTAARLNFLRLPARLRDCGSARDLAAIVTCHGGRIEFD